MLQFTRDHGQNKKGDKVEWGEIDHIDYLIKVGVLEAVGSTMSTHENFPEATSFIQKPVKKTTKK